MRPAAAPPGASEDGWTPPERFEEYRLVRELGRGAMGRVFLAHDVLLDRPVAVKFILAPDPSPHLRERFFAEARALARLQHPNVVAVYRVGEVQRRPYLVSEYVRGERLDQLTPRPDAARILELAVSLARGLAAAHRVNVLHRDLKPSNTLIAENGEVKLVDFGLAEVLDERAFRASVKEPALQRREGSGSEDTLELPALVRAPKKESASTTHPASNPARAVMGTPRYMAPELWRGDAATAQSDLYALGMVLFELFAGRTAFAEIDVEALAQHVQDEEAPPVSSWAQGVPPRWSRLIASCLARDPAARPSSAEALLSELTALGLRERKVDAAVSPYPGLAAFGTEQRSVFFGRSPDVAAILERLKATRHVFVAGDSGVGKSSVMHAGVLPAIADGALGQAVLTVSATPGSRPLHALASALAGALEGDPEQLAKQAATDPESLARELRRQPTPLLLFVDQLEELFTLAERPQAEAALGFLAAIVRTRGAYLCATVRSDFLTRVAGASAMWADALGSSLFLLRPLPEEGVREAIVGPAEAHGFAFESEDTVSALIAAARGGSGSLPLIQFALAQLWALRDAKRKVIPQDALTRLGGVRAALARHGDEVVAALPAEARTSAVELLCALVSEQGTRARRSEAELVRSDADRAALTALVKGRLVTTAESGGATEHQLAHEALISGWDSLQGWLARNAEGRAVRHRLERAAAEWERHGRTVELLWHDRQLAEVRRAELGDAAEGSVLAVFLAQSRARARRRKVVRVALVAAVPLLLLAGYIVIEVRAAAALREAVVAQLAEAEKAMGEGNAAAEQLAALHATVVADYDAGQLQRAEERWAAASTLTQKMEREHGKARRALEGALLLNPEESRTREMLATLADARSAFFHRIGRVEESEREAMLADPFRGAGVSPPTELRLTVSPAGAVAMLERYTVHGVRMPPDLPVAGGVTSLDPGSYVLVVIATDHAEARVPFLLSRHQHVDLNVRLVPAKQVPEGFVWIRGGTYLHGSADAEGIRSGFYMAPVLHRARTPDYLIARTETTFAEYIAFLRDLPPEERIGRMPQGSERGHRVLLEERRDGVFVLEMESSGHRYAAAEGEPIRYAGRQRRAEQDWRRFPVTGIRSVDAEAYARWLSRSGRVPGARLCTEREWERAARGADLRGFPGGDLLSADDANIDATYGRVPTAFGPDEGSSHPASRSPFGVDDMAGNVWEMVASLEVPVRPMIRSGCWYSGEITAAVVNRDYITPETRSPLIGFRVCAPADFAVR